MMSKPTSANALPGFAVLAVEVAPDQRKDRQGEDAREAQDDAASSTPFTWRFSSR